MPENRQYCCGMRNGTPTTSSVIAPPATNHSGRHSPAPGSATTLASGVATAASAPSSRTLSRMRRLNGAGRCGSIAGCV